jgi:hypothetical protein
LAVHSKVFLTLQSTAFDLWRDEIAEIYDRQQLLYPIWLIGRKNKSISVQSLKIIQEKSYEKP